MRKRKRKMRPSPLSGLVHLAELRRKGGGSIRPKTRVTLRAMRVAAEVARGESAAALDIMARHGCSLSTAKRLRAMLREVGLINDTGWGKHGHSN